MITHGIEITDNMKTTTEIYKESIAEFEKQVIGDAFAGGLFKGNKSQQMFSEGFKDGVKHARYYCERHIKSHTIAILDSSIERLRGELYENKTSECNCRGWDNGIQKEIDHLTAQRVMIERL